MNRSWFIIQLECSLLLLFASDMSTGVILEKFLAGEKDGMIEIKRYPESKIEVLYSKYIYMEKFRVGRLVLPVSVGSVPL